MNSFFSQAQITPSSKIRTRVADFISNDDNLYAKRFCMYVCL